MLDARITTEIDTHPYPLLFATISGAHLYGFPSPDSDYDLRGIHILPLKEVIGLHSLDETVEVAGMREDLEIDLVTHDIKKFFLLMLKKNGYVLEQLYSPLIVCTTPAHEELKEIGKACITKHHSHHYLGFAATEWRIFEKDAPHRVKPLLYIYRVLLTGIHLMQTGIVESNLLKLNEIYKLPYINELIDYKVSGTEMGVLPNANLAFHQGEYQRLVRQLEEAATQSHLPEQSSAREALSSLLVRVRLAA